MNKLTKAEIKILRLLDKHVGEPVKESTVSFLKNTLAFTLSEALDWWKLWYINQEYPKLYSYEEMTDIKRGYSFLADTIKPIISDDEKSPAQMADILFDEDIEKYKKMIGNYFNIAGNRTPDITYEHTGIEIHLPREDWEEWFSGMDEDSIWRYNDAKSYYSGSDTEQFETEEFDYINPTEEVYESLNKLGEIIGDNKKWSLGPTGSRAEDGEIKDWLEKNIRQEDADALIDEYLWSLGAEVTRSRNTELLEWYEENVEYAETECDGYSQDKCITIPYADLMLMIKDNEWVSLSELKDAALNSDLNHMGDMYYDSWLDDEGYDEVMSHFKEEIESLITKIENDDEYLQKIEKRKEFLSLLTKFKFKLGSYDWKCKGNKYVSEDGKLTVCLTDIDYEENKIKFTYNGETHLTPIDKFIPWVQGSVLDLKENVRIGKYRVIMESIAPNEEITKIAIFDFDGTLMNTPHAEEGKREWEEKTGKPYPHIGWWSKRESLDTNVFDIKPIMSTLLDYNVESDNPNTLIIMLTGRLPQQADQVEEILNGYNIIFDEYHYKDEGDTLKSKLHTIKSLLYRYPNVKFIEMYEDREPHALSFEEWGKDNDINIKVNLVTLN